MQGHSVTVPDSKSVGESLYTLGQYDRAANSSNNWGVWSEDKLRLADCVVVMWQTLNDEKIFELWYLIAVGR